MKRSIKGSVVRVSVTPKSFIWFTIACIFFAELVFGLEVLLRTINYLRYGNKYFLWPPFLSKVITPVPGVFPGVSDESRFYINSIGIRGDELPTDETIRFLAIGGSTTECGELDESETWPYQLQKKLSRLGNQKYWVGNSGRRGSTLRDTILHIKYFVPQIQNVNTILLLSGINYFMLALDPSYAPKPIAELATTDQLNHAFFIHPYLNQGIKGSALWRFAKQIKVLTVGRKKITDSEGKTQQFWRERRQKSQLLSTLPDLQQALAAYKKKLEYIVATTLDKGQRIILLTQPTLWKANMTEEEQKLLWFGCVENQEYSCYTPEALESGLNEFNQIMRQVCREKQVDCIDLAQLLPKDTTVFLDDVHFNESGAEKVAEIVRQYLKQKN